MPAAAPEPARPMKCPLPMLLANKEAPTCTKRTQILGDISARQAQKQRTMQTQSSAQNIMLKTIILIIGMK
jgi:hypothetical protein